MQNDVEKEIVQILKKLTLENQMYFMGLTRKVKNNERILKDKLNFKDTA